MYHDFGDLTREGWFRETQYIPEFGEFYKNVGFYDIVVIFDLVVFLVGVCFREGLFYFQFPIYPLSKDASIYFECRSVPKFLILEFPFILSSIRIS